MLNKGQRADVDGTLERQSFRVVLQSAEAAEPVGLPLWDPWPSDRGSAFSCGRKMIPLSMRKSRVMQTHFMSVFLALVVEPCGKCAANIDTKRPEVAAVSENQADGVET